jgi:hypothetical protein
VRDGQRGSVWITTRVMVTTSPLLSLSLFLSLPLSCCFHFNLLTLASLFLPCLDVPYYSIPDDKSFLRDVITDASAADEDEGEFFRLEPPTPEPHPSPGVCVCVCGGGCVGDCSVFRVLFPVLYAILSSLLTHPPLSLSCCDML